MGRADRQRSNGWRWCWQPPWCWERRRRSPAARATAAWGRRSRSGSRGRRAGRRPAAGAAAPAGWSGNVLSRDASGHWLRGPPARAAPPAPASGPRARRCLPRRPGCRRRREARLDRLPRLRALAARARASAAPTEALPSTSPSTSSTPASTRTTTSSRRTDGCSGGSTPSPPPFGAPSPAEQRPVSSRARRWASASRWWRSRGCSARRSPWRGAFARRRPASGAARSRRAGADERGQAAVEFVALVLLAALVLGALVAASPRFDGRSFGGFLAFRIVCTIERDCHDGDGSLTRRTERATPPSSATSPPTWSTSRASGSFPSTGATAAASPAPRRPDEPDLDVHRTHAGERATAFTRILRRGGRTYLQYWFYYPDSRSTWAGSDDLWDRAWGQAEDRGFIGETPAYPGTHRDDWEAYAIRIDPGGRAWVRASSHRHWQGCMRLWCKNRWTARTGWTRVSRGSHAGHIPIRHELRGGPHWVYPRQIVPLSPAASPPPAAVPDAPRRASTAAPSRPRPRRAHDHRRGPPPGPARDPRRSRLPPHRRGRPPALAEGRLLGSGERRVVTPADLDPALSLETRAECVSHPRVKGTGVP